MVPPIQILLALAAGLTAGAAYFGGLWWTVRRLPSARHPALLLGVSLLLRVVLAVLVFASLSRYGWQVMAVALGGFAAAKIVSLLLSRCLAEDETAPMSTDGKTWN